MSFLRACVAPSPSVRQELDQYLALGFHTEQRNEFLDEQDRAAFVSECEDLAVELAECLEAFAAPGTEGLAVGLVDVLIVALWSTRSNVVRRVFREARFSIHWSNPRD